jgi:tRNA pseudouridine38-40 synthase
VSFSQLISAWTREMSAPGRRRSVSLRRPMVNSGLSMLTMRRPSASVITSRGAGGESVIATRLYASPSGRPRGRRLECRVPRFKLTIEYAGTRYSGWQIQKNARTVQGEIDRAVRAVTGRNDFELYGSGRTDAGVHALAQTAHLDVSTTLPPETLRRRLNDELPADINILGAAPVPHRFHARHDAVARRYLYQIATRRTAFAKPYVWWVKEAVDAGRMREAARAFVGLRDFRSFAASDARDEPDEPAASTRVLVEHLDVVDDRQLILVSVQGSHFLWKMVRRIVGVLVEIGRGALEPDAAATFLTGSSPTPARLTAPPSGLFLNRVYYAGDRRDSPLEPVTPI